MTEEQEQEESCERGSGSGINWWRVSDSDDDDNVSCGGRSYDRLACRGGGVGGGVAGGGGRGPSILFPSARQGGEYIAGG